MNKTSIRRRLLKQRLAISPKEVATKSRLIAGYFLASIDWEKVKSAHVYQSVKGWNEVDTTELIKSLRKKGVVVTVASLNKDQPIPAKQFDLIIVPVLGFDKNNHRLGLGGGWYDRFLASQPQAKKVGLAYRQAFIAAGLPAEPHDVRLDSIITEASIMTP